MELVREKGASWEVKTTPMHDWPSHKSVCVNNTIDNETLPVYRIYRGYKTNLQRCTQANDLLKIDFDRISYGSPCWDPVVRVGKSQQGLEPGPVSPTQIRTLILGGPEVSRPRSVVDGECLLGLYNYLCASISPVFPLTDKVP